MSNYQQIYEEIIRNQDRIREDLYLKIIQLIALKKYNIKQIRELVFTIHTLLKVEPDNCKELTIRFIKISVSKRIYRRIKNEKEVYKILYELIKLDMEINNTEIRKVFDYIKNSN